MFPDIHFALPLEISLSVSEYNDTKSVAEHARHLHGRVNEAATAYHQLCRLFRATSSLSRSIDYKGGKKFGESTG